MEFSALLNNKNDLFIFEKAAKVWPFSKKNNNDEEFNFYLNIKEHVEKSFFFFYLKEKRQYSIFQYSYLLPLKSANSSAESILHFFFFFLSVSITKSYGGTPIFTYSSRALELPSRQGGHGHRSLLRPWP